MRDALDDAAEVGLEVVSTTSGHRWGYMRCTTCGQRRSVWSTPRNAENHAKDIRRFADRHRHEEQR
ncbi:MAG: hypothetical protein ACRDQA_28720 [Nocardioidaceae bacterium]